MAVLVEGISVLARRDRLDELFPGGSEQYIVDCPNATACADQHLVRFGFTTPDRAEKHVRRLESLGFIFLDERGVAQDIVVVDQLQGPTSPCEWLEYGHVVVQGGRAAAARLVGSSDNALCTPPEWTYDNSLTKSHQFVRLEDVVSRMKFLRETEGQFAYADAETGKVWYSHAPPSRPQLVDLAAITRLIDDGDAANALARLELELDDDPNSGQAWSMKGFCLRVLGRTGEAVSALQRATKLGYNDVGTVVYLAKSLEDCGDNKAAETHFRRVAKENPDDCLLIHQRGAFYVRQGEASRAAEVCRAALWAMAREIVRNQECSNLESGPIYNPPAECANAWMGLAAYAAMYSACITAGYKSFLVPDEKSAEAEARSRLHGGLFWEDFPDADGERSRRYFPNFFNAFYRQCWGHSLYLVMLEAYGEALQAIGDEDAADYLGEAALLRSLASHESKQGDFGVSTGHRRGRHT
jgi:tetratricopeptide (TPR) repeat protein